MSRVPASRYLPILALGAILGLSACGGPVDAPTATGTKKVTYLGKESIPKDKAQMVYQQTCMACHETGVGPVITGRDLPPEAIKMFVRNGNGAMPAFTEAMIDNETLDSVAMLVSESKATTPQTSQ